MERSFDGVLVSGSEFSKCGILPILDKVCNTGKFSNKELAIFLEHKQLELELKESLISISSLIE